MQNSLSNTKKKNEPKPKENQIFVGGLPKKATNEGLMKHFLQFGRLTECRINTDPETNKNRGFAFVSFEDKKVYDKILLTDHANFKYLGATLTVKPAQSKETSSSIKIEEKERKVFVVGLSFKTKDEDLRKSFSKFGEIEKIELIAHKGFAFLLFKKKIDVIEVLNYNQPITVLGKVVECRKVLIKEEETQQKVSTGPFPNKFPNNNPSYLTSTYEYPVNPQGYYYQPPISTQNMNYQYPRFNYSITEPDGVQEEIETRPRRGNPTELGSIIGNLNLSSILNDQTAQNYSGKVDSSREWRENQGNKGSSNISSGRKERLYMGMPSEPNQNKSDRLSVPGSKKDKSVKSGSGKNANATSRIEADQEKTINFLYDDEDQVKQSGKAEGSSFHFSDRNYDLTSTQVSGFGTESVFGSISNQNQVLENPKLFSLFVAGSEAIEKSDKNKIKSQFYQSNHTKDEIRKMQETYYGEMRK